MDNSRLRITWSCIRSANVSFAFSFSFAFSRIGGFSFSDDEGPIGIRSLTFCFSFFPQIFDLVHFFHFRLVLFFLVSFGVEFHFCNVKDNSKPGETRTRQRTGLWDNEKEQAIDRRLGRMCVKILPWNLQSQFLCREERCLCWRSSFHLRRYPIEMVTGRFRSA